MIFDEESQSYKPRPVQDKTLTVKKVHEFQFYPDFARLQELCLKIQKMQENYEKIPQELKDEFNEQISQGFSDWSLKDYY